MSTFSLKEFAAALWSSTFEDRVVLWDKQSKATRLYGAGQLDALQADAMSLAATRDVYLGLSTQPADLRPTSRGTNETAQMLPGFFVDIDFAEAKDSAKRYPPDEQTALALLESFEVEPFLIQNSGNGLHVIYAADRPMPLSNRADRRRAQVLLRAFHRKIAKH
jgi:hypothetical protein